MNRLPLPPSRRILSAAAVFVLGTLALGACSSTANSLSSTASSIAKAAGSGSTGSGGGGSISAALQQLSQKTSSATHATYKATYTSTNTSGGTSSSETIVIAQQGTKSSFTTGSGSFYSDGTTDTFCDNSSGTTTCTQSKGTSVNPLAGLLSLFNPSTASAEIQAVAAASGVSVSRSSETHGGLASSCYSYSKAGQGVKFCFSADGIVTYIATSTGTFELQSYTTNVSDSDVSVPAGVTIVTTPSVP